MTMCLSIVRRFLGVMMVNALAASDRILIPVQTEFLAMKGLRAHDSHFGYHAEVSQNTV